MYELKKSWSPPHIPSLLSGPTSGAGDTQFPPELNGPLRKQVLGRSLFRLFVEYVIAHGPQIRSNAVKPVCHIGAQLLSHLPVG